MWSAVSQELVKEETKIDEEKKDRNASYLHVMECTLPMIKVANLPFLGPMAERLL